MTATAHSRGLDGRTAASPTPTLILTTADTARRLGVSPATIRAWEQQGALVSRESDAGRRGFDAGDLAELENELDFLSGLLAAAGVDASSRPPERLRLMNATTSREA